MTPPDLDALLEKAAEVERLRGALRHSEALESEAGRLEDVVRAAPRLHTSADAAVGKIEPLARELEREWVAQGPLVELWERAAEFAELAEAAGADTAPYRAYADEARRTVEAARLQTREQRERLAAHRQRLADALLQTPLELDPPPPVADDARPEALRRDALELMRLAHEAEAAADAAAAGASERLNSLRAELAEVGAASALAARLADLERELPDEVELDSDTPPSVAIRLRRAGLRVR
jgi:hypothetical protein